MKTELEHLVQLNKTVGRIEERLDSINKAMEIHDKSDTYFHKKLDDELKIVNKNMAVYNDQLAEHMRRTELLEVRAEKLRPIEHLVVWLGVSLRTIAIAASILGVLKLLDIL